MTLFVGLGNPGNKYTQNRHNVGFMFADFLIDKTASGSSKKFEKKFDAEVTFLKNPEQELVIMKPQTFMNASGDAVQKLMNFYKIERSSLYIVHDDLDIPFGKFKIQQGTGPKLHNGIESIEQQLGYTDFHRIRIGVENRAGAAIPGEAYVLQNFTEDERRRLPDIFSSILSHPLLKNILSSISY